MTVFLSVLPWLVIALVIVEFSLADDLPAPPVRRAFLVTGLGLVLLTAGMLWISPGSSDWSYLLVAVGPAAFLLIHHVLRSIFRKWKGDEPVLMTTGSSSGMTGRFFYETDTHRRVGFTDYVYSFLLGAGMLLAAAAAIEKLVGAAG